jgi:DNA-binding MarR family transcriptional regulator
MSEEKIKNLFGALSLAIADDLLREAQHHVPLSAPASAITLIGHAPGMTIDQLSRVLGLSHPGTVRLVDRLVREKLLNRERSATDGRAVALTLSPTGEAMCQKILASRQSALARALAMLSPTERSILGRLSETMLQGIVKGETHALEICRLCDPSVCSECPIEGAITPRESER